MRTEHELTFSQACSLVRSALQGSLRREVVHDAAQAAAFGKSLSRLRDAMRADAWTAGTRRATFHRFVRRYDALTRADGFHVLHDWDGKADKVNEETIPVDVLDYLVLQRGGEPPDRAALAILVDYYFVHVLALLSLRIWDEGDADANIDTLDRLLHDLQGPDGSGQRFVENAETLILIATSHFEVVERGYARLLQRVRTLNRSHQVNIALGHALSMGCHLRFGFEATYARDTSVMRDDNVADYPWLCFALVTLLREYARLDAAGAPREEQEPLVEGLLNGLSPDARAFVGVAPGLLASCEAERSEFRALFRQHREALLESFEPYRPSPHAYSPLAFFFNFSHNVLKGTVVDALLRGEPWRLAFNDLLTARPLDAPSSGAKEQLAVTLMGYARANPDRIRGRLMPVIVYDPQAGRQAFTVTMRKLKE